MRNVWLPARTRVDGPALRASGMGLPVPSSVTSIMLSFLPVSGTNKEQLLQESLLVNRAPPKLIAEVGAGSGSPAVKLYRLLRFDTMQLALSPIDFNEIQRIAHDQRTEFHQFWTDYERLKDWVVDLIGAAISEGRFIDCDREETAGLLLNFDEGAQKRSRISAQAAQFGDAAIVLRVAQPRPE
jgi:hypothetical protein